MPLLNTILKELKNVPVDRLEDLYLIIRSLQANTKKLDESSREILFYAGAFEEMSLKDYSEFLEQIRQTRNDCSSKNQNN